MDRLNFLSTHFLIKSCYRGSGGKEEIRNKQPAENGISKLSKNLILSHVHCPIPTHQQCFLKQGSLDHRERKNVGDLMKPFSVLPTSWQQELWASARLRRCLVCAPPCLGGHRPHNSREHPPSTYNTQRQTWKKSSLKKKKSHSLSFSLLSRLTLSLMFPCSPPKESRSSVTLNSLSQHPQS